jgi:hypothetical protein
MYSVMIKINLAAGAQKLGFSQSNSRSKDIKAKSADADLLGPFSDEILHVRQPGG